MEGRETVVLRVNRVRIYDSTRPGRIPSSLYPGKISKEMLLPMRVRPLFIGEFLRT